ncbi:MULTISPECIES: FAD-binding oxidoreductase [Prochlorococcus]|nr:FAD-binding oxidoreductase [Prochlorococcus marinus]
MKNLEIISGWGLYPRIQANIIKPKTIKELRDAILSNSFIARGNGRSYGDSAINQFNTIEMTEFNRFLHFNEKEGLVIAQAGILLKDIIETFLPKGWFPPVTPGTKYVTLGGMVAANVHGKNHYKSGTFSKYIKWIEIIDHNGEIIKCSRKKNSELFLWTIGGMGLTGIILNVAFYLKRIKTAWINQSKLVSKNINQTFEFFESNIDSSYSVAWIDCYAKGLNIGRSVLMLGEHAELDDINSYKKLSPFKTFKKRKLSIPFFFPSFVLSNFSVKIFNSLNFIVSKISRRKAIVDWDTFFYPLDKILNWNKIYGSKGFAQFQCVIPLSVSKKAITEMLNLISNSKSSSFLAVLKRFGQDESHFSFPMEGYSLSLDFPINKENLLLINSLDEITIKYDGRFYLVKDSRMKKKTFESSDLRIKNFKAFREDNLSKKFRSCQTDRLGL